MPLASGFSSKAVHRTSPRTPTAANKPTESAANVSQRKGLRLAIPKTGTRLLVQSRVDSNRGGRPREPHKSCKAKYAQLQAQYEQMKLDHQILLNSSTVHRHCIQLKKELDYDIMNLNQKYFKAPDDPKHHVECREQYDLLANKLEELKRNYDQMLKQIEKEYETSLSAQRDKYQQAISNNKATWEHETTKMNAVYDALQKDCDDVMRGIVLERTRQRQEKEHYRRVERPLIIQQLEQERGILVRL